MGRKRGPYPEFPDTDLFFSARPAAGKPAGPFLLGRHALSWKERPPGRRCGIFYVFFMDRGRAPFQLVRLSSTLFMVSGRFVITA